MSIVTVYKVTENATIPSKQSQWAAGYDLYSAYDYTVQPMDKELVFTDLIISVPRGYYGRIAPRSGLAYNYFIDVGAGVIDSDYRGNVGILIFNFGKEEFNICKGDRVAQIIFEKIAQPEIREALSIDAIDITERGSCGFGSTGVK
ncbi:dUTPase [Finch poxvirus]|uniref:Deoxyuridine 5'-triphosphate nucleotidohydrolase n=2 Tax=unclassified Avipoxvirus TaxID=336487 RepID=A0AAT9UQ60_9POXV|nr:dUTPase [Finch poxvirus]UOX39101.1 dUTPase [Finch poxvirus]